MDLKKHKVLKIREHDLANAPFGDKSFLLAQFRKLPSDAELCGSYSEVDDRGDNIYCFKFWSCTWPEIGPGETAPEVTYWVSTEEVEREKDKPLSLNLGPAISSVTCLCDFEYTGLRHHKINCPIVKKALV